MRSCEYLTVRGPRKTKLLCIQDFQFIRNNEDITSDTAHIASADLVMVTFREQKNGERNESISLGRTNDASMCPVRLAVSIITHLHKIPSTTPFTTINTYISGSTVTLLTSEVALKRLHAKARSLGQAEAGFLPDEYWTPFRTQRRSHGHDPGRHPHIHGDDHGPLEKRRVPQVHTQTSRRVHKRREPTDDFNQQLFSSTSGNNQHKNKQHTFLRLSQIFGGTRGPSHGTVHLPTTTSP